MTCQGDWLRSWYYRFLLVLIISNMSRVYFAVLKDSASLFRKIYSFKKTLVVIFVVQIYIWKNRLARDKIKVVLFLANKSEIHEMRRERKKLCAMDKSDLWFWHPWRGAWLLLTQQQEECLLSIILQKWEITLNA